MVARATSIGYPLTMELGLATFADLAAASAPQQRMRELIEEIELADQLGLDVFAIGEHHRPDFLVSSPAVVLGAAAVRTERIRLSSAVTVLSSDDPVRVFQDFAEVDLLSGGRAEIMAGRGSFIESFPLFGYDLDDYDELFAEKLELLLALREQRARDAGPGATAPALERRRRLPAARAGAAARLGRRRRLAAVGRPRRHARAAADARDHRRPARALRAARRALPRGLRRRPATTPRRRASRSTRTASSPTPQRAGRRGLRRAVPGDDEPHRPRARLAAVGAAPSTRRCARPTARSPSARPSRSPRRSSSSTSSSATTATSRR